MRPRHIPGEHHYQHYSHGFRANPPYRLDLSLSRRVSICHIAVDPPLTTPPLFCCRRRASRLRLFAHPSRNRLCRQARPDDGPRKRLRKFLALALLIFVVRLKKEKKNSMVEAAVGWQGRERCSLPLAFVGCLLFNSDSPFGSEVVETACFVGRVEWRVLSGRPSSKLTLRW